MPPPPSTVRRGYGTSAPTRRVGWLALKWGPARGMVGQDSIGSALPQSREVHVSSVGPRLTVGPVAAAAVHGAGSPQVLIASLKAGGVGLNLTSASQVHLLDPWQVCITTLPLHLPLCEAHVGRRLSYFKAPLLLKQHHAPPHPPAPACRWNPAVEEQAMDRVHRMGQKRAVHIFRHGQHGVSGVVGDKGGVL